MIGNVWLIGKTTYPSKQGVDMNRTVVKSKVGSDGILHLDLPLGAEEAEREVLVSIEPARAAMTQEQWRAWVQSMAGSITDPNFERPPQLPFEERKPLS